MHQVAELVGPGRRTEILVLIPAEVVGLGTSTDAELVISVALVHAARLHPTVLAGTYGISPAY